MLFPLDRIEPIDPAAESGDLFAALEDPKQLPAPQEEEEEEEEGE